MMRRHSGRNREADSLGSSNTAPVVPWREDQEESRGTFAQWASGVTLGVGRNSQPGDADGRSEVPHGHGSGTYVERRSRTRTSGRNEPMPWHPDGGDDGGLPGQDWGLGFRRRFRGLVQPVGAENENPNEQVTGASKAAALRTRKLPRTKSRGFDPEDMATDEQLQKIGFIYGDAQLEPGFSMKRWALHNVRQYISEIRTPNASVAWEMILSPADYKCLRLKQMEPPGSGEYTNFARLRDLYGHCGIFRCRGCKSFLFLPEHFVDEGYPWATFRAHLPLALARDPANKKSYLCCRCKSFVGRDNQAGGIFACSRSLYFQPMVKDEQDLIVRTIQRKSQLQEPVGK